MKKTVSGLNDIASIATSIGLDIPGLGEAVQYGNIAASAFTAFASGNYLGAIASVTSVFQKRVDPDAERFKILMGYLQKQFAEINKKLDIIIENQQKMMEALVKLSDQMRTYYVALDERLARMEFELHRIGDTARAELWKDWQPCFALYSHIVENETKYGYMARKDFARIDDVYSAIGTIGSVAKQCVIVGQTRPISISAPNWFGNFLSAQNAVTVTPDPLPDPEKQSVEMHTKSELSAFIEQTHAPSRALLYDLLVRASLSTPRAVELLMSPGYSYADLPKRIGAKSDGPACGPSGYLQERVRRLVCGSGMADQTAKSLMDTPMVVDLAVVISEWLLAASRFGDLINQETDWFVSQGDLLKHAANTMQSMSPGEDIVNKTLAMLDASVSAYSLLYGDLIARAVADVLFNPGPTGAEEAAWRAELAKKAVPLLQRNAFLAANVAMIRMRDRYQERLLISGDNSPSLVEYRTSLMFALSATADPTLLLRGVFGDDMRFSVDREKGKVLLNLTGTESPQILVPIPEPKQCVEGRFIYPRRMTELIVMRQRVADRLADYRATATLSPEERTVLIEAVARAEQQQPEKVQ